MNERQQNQSMSLIVRTVCGWVKGFILLYGIQVTLYGHLTPGGGFAGGVIAAAAFVLIVLAEGEQEAVRTFSRRAASTWDSVGVLLFLSLAVSGIFVTGVFFVNFWSTPPSARFELLSSGIILPSNVGIGFKVCVSLYLVLLVSTSIQHGTSTKGKREEV